MAWTVGQRTRGVTHARRDVGLALRRGAAGSAALSVAGALGWTLHGWASLLGVLVAIPGAYTLMAAGSPWTAPCPACGTILGNHTLALPDESIPGPRATDVRCPACGIYVDTLDGEVREVPFNRLLDTPEYTVSLPARALADTVWGPACVRCGHPATCGLSLGGGGVGLLTVEGAAVHADTDPHRVPWCDNHVPPAEPVARSVVVARTGDRITVQCALYATYRAFLDANRDRVDVAVRHP